MAKNNNSLLKDELEEINAGSNPEIDDSRTRKSPQGLSCYVGRCGINYSSPICSGTNITCHLYDNCRNPEKPKKY